MNNLVPGRSAWMLRAGFAALALILVALLAACGGDAVPGEDADTEAPAPEATDRVRAPAPGSPASDREILVTFYNALDGPNWEDSGNWLTDAPLGEWYGVTTDDNGRVIWLQVGASGSGQELRGEIPLELIDLGALEVLGLDDYDGGLRGEIPPEFGNFPNLQYLSLSGSGLTGEIPPELGNLANLQHLRLRGEGLSGGIPPELGNLKQLYELSIYGTQLGGVIPPELGNIRLSELHLNDNELSGEIPPWLGDLSDLLALDLRGNQLSGEIPSEVWDMLEREVEIEIYGNDFPCLTGALRHLYIEQRANC